MAKKKKYTIKPVKREEVTGVDREILSKTVDDGVYPLSMAKEIRIDRIKPDPDQPRKTMDPTGLEELAASIKEQGILQPLVVEFVDDAEMGYFRLIHGERRWRAAQMAGLERVPAIIREVDSDATKLIQRLMENIQREDLNAVDRAEALKELKAHLGGISWEKIADRVGIKRSRLFQLLDVTKQPEAIKEDIRAGVLSEKHSRALQSLPTDLQTELHQVIVKESLSGAKALALSKKAKDSPPGWTVAQGIEELKREKRRKADPLAALSRLEKAIDKIAPEEVNRDELQKILSNIVAKASALLSQIEAEEKA